MIISKDVLKDIKLGRQYERERVSYFQQVKKGFNHEKSKLRYSSHQGGKKTGLIRGGEFSSSLIQRYISFLDVKPRTVEAYSKNLKPFFLFAQSKGVNSSWQITRSLILEYRDFLKAGKKPTTVQSYITALRLFIRWASQEGLMENVADHIKGAKLDRSHKKDYLTAEQVKRLLASVDRSSLSGARDYAILLLSITGALRTIEIVRANIEDLRTVGDSPVVVQTVTDTVANVEPASQVEFSACCIRVLCYYSILDTEFE